MPGYLSHLFDPNDGGSHAEQGQQHFAVEDSPDVHQDVGVHTEFSGSYQDPNGTTHSFDSTHDVNADLDVQATLSVVVDTSQGAFTGDGFEE